jgi:hypothetical protein
MDTKMTTAEESLAMANGFSSLKGKKIPVKGHEFVVERINLEFQSWIEQRMNEVMSQGSQAASEMFTPEEASALKTMAQQILARKNAPVSLQPSQDRANLSPSMDHKKFKESNGQILNLARHLSQLDNSVDSQGRPIEF